MSNLPMTWAELKLAPLKCCTKCKEPKQVTEFYHQRNGRMARCKDCHNRAMQGRQRIVRIGPPTVQTLREAEAIGRELFGVFRTWQGGTPRTDWRADMGRVCWPVEWQAVAA